MADSSPLATALDLRRAGVYGYGSIGGVTLLPDMEVAGEPEAAVPFPEDPLYDYFVKVGDIAGESVVDDHEDWIDVLAWRWGARVPPDIGEYGERPPPSALVFWAESSFASPDLWLAVHKHRRLPEAALDVVHQATGFPLMTLRLDDVAVTSYEVALSGEDGTPVDVVQLEYARAIYTVRQRETDGSVGTVVTRSFTFAPDDPSESE